MEKTHVFCDEVIDPKIDNLTGLLTEVFLEWIEKIERFENIHIYSIANIPSDASFKKKTLQSQDIQSLISIPLISGKSLIRFLDFNSVRKEKIGGRRYWIT